MPRIKPFKLPVPDDREVVAGMWLDIIDNWSLLSDASPMIVGLGLSVTSSNIIKFATSVSIPTGQTRDIWDNATDLVYLDSAETINIASTSIQDDVGGTGAFIVMVSGLTDDLTDTTELVTLNGQADVPTVNQYKRIYRMRVVTADQAAGADAGAVGTITATAAVAGTIQASMDNGNNQTLMSQFTIPKGKVGMVMGGAASVGRNDDATFLLKTRVPGSVFNLGLTLKLYQATQQIVASIPLGPLPAGTDIKFQAIAGTNNTVAHVSYTVQLIDADVLTRGAQ
jgi:hypothetical protein